MGEANLNISLIKRLKRITFFNKGVIFLHKNLVSEVGLMGDQLYAMIKIWVNTDISVLRFYRYIGNIDKISVDIFT